MSARNAGVVRRSARPVQVVPVDPEPLEVGQGQVDPAAAEVLGDVTDEVGQLEGQTELAGRLPGRGRSAGSRIGSIIVPITAAEPSM